MTNSAIGSAATLVDEEGNSYRAVGAASARFTSNAVDGGDRVGHLTINVTFVGEEGLLGHARERLQLNPDGRVVERTTGSCQLPPE